MTITAEGVPSGDLGTVAAIDLEELGGYSGLCQLIEWQRGFRGSDLRQCGSE